MALLMTAGVSLQASGAIFSDSTPGTGDFGAKAIFPGQRVTPAFIVDDASGGGAPVDRSSESGFSGDGRTYTSGNWSAAFATSRYLDVDMNAPLPGGLSVSSATFEFGFSSSTPGSTACYSFEVRRISTGAVLGAFGTASSPIACVTGTGSSLSATSIASTVITTDTLNDLRIRVLAADTASGGIVIDRATVSGATAYANFTLYPVRLWDAADTTVSMSPWGLAGP
ncbi:MAG: hypothetical protein ABJC39_12650 [Chloroflexota bacterium]